ncbi:beta-lactamase family protein [Undibacterium sp. FT79W]|uniref:serine hydrolase domain-containing protein n=1 Tax=Undibacterium sp. FT79W TaxID=2762296 RepID=UPI00164C13AE|nr:serine hydrolase domain-containing protein [Undibacterium sp. FT79W]MBC3879612.1 beta-lactamase family protein [Undibacterium sp. FT79W]
MSRPLRIAPACCALIIGLTLFGTCATSQAAADALPAPAQDDDTAERVRAIDAMLQRYLKPGVPGAVVLVTDHRTPLFRKAYGLAKVSENVALDPGMSLRVGSITKQFTAAAIMLLVEQGKLALSDKVGQYLPAFAGADSPVTIEHLLTHTSGIRNYTELPHFIERMNSDVSVEDGIAFFKDAKPEFAPGDRFAYSNSNYFLLGAIIEHVSGMPYADFMARNVFEPLQLTHTRIETAATPADVVGYTQERRKVTVSPEYSMRWPYAAGALRTSVDDLALWDQAIVHGKLLKPESWQRMVTSYRLHGIRATGYGYGFFVRSIRNKAAIEHGGDIGGFSADMMRFPQEEIFITVLANNDAGDPTPDELVAKIAAIVLPR